MTVETSKHGTGHLGPPPALSRNNSHTSQRSIHSQRSHSSQTHHVTPSDPSTLANLMHGLSDDDNTPQHHQSNHGAHAHPQHRNLFVAQDGMTGMPSFEELVVTEERDWLEGVAEDEDREQEYDPDPQETTTKSGTDANRRKSVTFQQAIYSGSTSSTAVSTSEDGLPSSCDNGKTAVSENDESATERDPLLPTGRHTTSQAQYDDSVFDPTKDPHEWARIREGSIARRSRWRRPGPYW